MNEEWTMTLTLIAGFIAGGLFIYFWHEMKLTDIAWQKYKDSRDNPPPLVKRDPTDYAYEPWPFVWPPQGLCAEAKLNMRTHELRRANEKIAELEKTLSFIGTKFVIKQDGETLTVTIK